MRIAICNTDKNFSENTKRMIYSYFESKRMEALVDCFLSGEEILTGKVKYNIVFLDYALKGKNGLEIAAELRKISDNTAIVFLSRQTDFVFDAFKVDAYRFIVSPIDEGAMFGFLDEYFARFGIDYPIWIKSSEETVCLKTSDIYYLEADNKHCLVHLRDCVLPCKKTMACVYNVLPKNHFFKINRAFVVNFNHIRKYNNDLIYLKNGKSIHISRNYLRMFKEEYYNYSSPLLP